MKIFFKITWNEIKKEILTVWSYRLQWAGEFLSLIIFFMFLITFTQERQIAAVNYCIWFYCILIIGDVSGRISVEMKSGTLEHIYFSTIPILLLFFAKIISSIFRSFFIMCGLFNLLFLFGYVEIFNLRVERLISSVIVITPGLFGLSLIIGGLTILLKDVSWIINVFNNSLLFLSGIFLPINSFPKWLQNLAHLSIITKSLEVVNGDYNFLNWIILSISSFLYLMLGYMIFLYCEKKKSKKNGIDWLLLIY